RSFFDDDHAARLAHRSADGLPIDGRETANIDHLGVESFGCLHRVMNHQQPRENGHTLAFAPYGSLADRNDVVFSWHVARRIDGSRFRARALRAIEELVFENEHGIAVAQRGLEQSLGVVRIGWSDDLEPGDAGEIALHVLRVLRTSSGCT